MNRCFIEAIEFTKKWHSIGLTDDDLKELQLLLLENPKAGPVMKGTGGLRKIRFSLPNSGKSGGIRVCYIDLETVQIVYLIDVFAKNEKENLTQSERNEIKKAIESLKRSIEKGVIL